MLFRSSAALVRYHEERSRSFHDRWGHEVSFTERSRPVSISRYTMVVPDESSEKELARVAGAMAVLGFSQADLRDELDRIKQRAGAR